MLKATTGTSGTPLVLNTGHTVQRRDSGGADAEVASNATEANLVAPEVLRAARASTSVAAPTGVASSGPTSPIATVAAVSSPVVMQTPPDDMLSEMLRLAEQRWPGDPQVRSLPDKMMQASAPQRETATERLLDLLTAPEGDGKEQLKALLQGLEPPKTVAAVKVKHGLQSPSAAASQERDRYDRLHGLAEKVEQSTDHHAHQNNIQEATNQGVMVEKLAGKPVTRIYYTGGTKGAPRVRHFVAAGQDFTVISSKDVPSTPVQVGQFPTARYGVKQGTGPQTFLVDGSHISDQQRALLQQLVQSQPDFPAQVRIYQPEQSPLQGARGIDPSPLRAIKDALQPFADELRAPDGSLKRPHVAYADVDLGRGTVRLGAISGTRLAVEFSPDGQAKVHRVQNAPEYSGMGRFAVMTDEGNPRLHDTEVKLLNRIDAQLHGNRQPSGTIKLVGELSTCISCRGVVEAFREMYPKIDLQVYYDKTGSETYEDHAGHDHNQHH